MPERLNSSDYRFLAICAAVLAVSVWFSTRYFYRAFPEASIDFAVTREQSRDLAMKFLQARGASLDGYREASRFDFDDNAKTFLERELGLEQANQVMGSQVRLWRWSHRWFRPMQKEEFRADISPKGELVAYEHLVEEAAPGARLTAEQAREVAGRFLKDALGRDPGALEFVESSSETRPARADHVFTWKAPGIAIHDSTYRLEVTVIGDQAGGYREYLKVPEAWQRDYERLRSRNQTAQSVDSAFSLLLAVGLLITLLLRIRGRDVRWRTAGLFGTAAAALSFLASWNAHPLAEFGYPTTDSYASFVTGQIMQSLLGSLAAGGFIFCLTAAAEPLYREFCPSFVSLSNLAGRRSLRTKSFLLGSALGLALTGFFVSYQIGFYLLAYRFGAWSPADVPYSDLLNTRFPWLFVLLGGFFPAVSEEFLFRLFAIPFLRRATRSLLAGVILAGFLWGFGHAGYPQQPFYIRGVEVGIGGVLLGFVMLRWGILPTLVWHYSVDAMYSALLLLRSNNTYFLISGAITAGIMVLPLAVALIGYLRRGGFESAEGLTNGDEGTSRHAPSAPATSGGGALEYTPWTPARRAAALGIAAVCGLAMLAPVERFGRREKFSITAAEAKSRADRLVRDAGFRSVAYTVQDGAGEAKYFLEREPLHAVNQRLEASAPPHRWNVRYYKPMDKEEFVVAVDRSTGKITGFDHRLPEDRPGADLDAAAAQRLAEVHLAAEGFDLSRLELKESSSEKLKARRDHHLVWEARPGDARNLDEARYRVEVQVAGGSVSGRKAFFKLPEAWERKRSERTALSNALTGVRLAAGAGLLVAALLLLAKRTREGQLRWRPAMAISIGLTALTAAGAVIEWPLSYRSYNTAVALASFETTLASSLAMRVAAWFVAFAMAAAFLAAVNPGAPLALRRENRVRMGLDALLAAVLAAALAPAVGQLRGLLAAQFHSHWLPSASDASLFASPLPAVSALADGAGEWLLLLVAAAMGAYIVRTRPAGLLLIAPALVSSGVRTGSEYALSLALAMITAAAFTAFCAWFARGNLLAYALAAWTLVLGSGAAELTGQPARELQTQGWIVAGALAATVLWAVFPALRAGPAENRT